MSEAPPVAGGDGSQGSFPVLFDSIVHCLPGQSPDPTVGIRLRSLGPALAAPRLPRQKRITFPEQGAEGIRRSKRGGICPCPRDFCELPIFYPLHHDIFRVVNGVRIPLGDAIKISQLELADESLAASTPKTGLNTRRMTSVQGWSARRLIGSLMPRLPSNGAVSSDR